MAVPLIQAARIGAYLVGKKLKGQSKYPLVLMLEPLFRCNLACPGCGKIDYEDGILNKRLSAEECLQAVDECAIGTGRQTQTEHDRDEGPDSSPWEGR